jgi:hypothetical protein
MSVKITRMIVQITRMIVQITTRVPKSQAGCQHHTCACDIAASQNSIRNFLVILVGSCQSHTHSVEI